MVKKIGMPKASPTMERGSITWLVNEGDEVSVGQEIFEVQTDKASVPQASFESGTIHKIVVLSGGEANVDEAVAYVREEGESAEDADAYIASEEEKVKAAKKASSQEESQDRPSDEPQEEKKTVATGGGMQEPAFEPAPPLPEYDFSQLSTSDVARIKISPLARKIARSKGLDLSKIKGTGPGGRIVEKDVKSNNPDLSVAFGQKAVPHTVPGSFEEEPMTQMRKVIGKRLQESKTFIPHFYVTQEINMEPVVALRKQLIEGGLKVSFNDFVVKATALALKEHPNVNSGYNSVKQTLTRYKTVDISIAVSIPDGLITPIVRLANHKNLGQISAEVKDLARRAIKGKLAPEEFSGGSFTISNMGMFGVTQFAGIINPPQAGILSIGGIEEKPVVREGKIVPGKTMMITLSADHRVIDGADGAAFIKCVQKYLENPALLLV